MSLKDKLSSRDKILVRLALWAGLFTWMVFYTAAGILVAQRLTTFGSDIFGTGTVGSILAWVAPVWVVFTILLTDVLIARYVRKKI